MIDGYFGFDSVVYPLPSLVTNPTPTLQLGDPVYYQVCAFFSQLLNTNLLPRFSDEARACGMTNANLSNWIDGYAVAQTVAFPLTPEILKTTDFRFPLLSIYVEREFARQNTLSTVATQRDVVIAWIMPPLSVGQYNRLYDFFGMATKTWLAYGPQGFDPKVTPHGPSIWTTSNLSFGAIREFQYLHYLGLDKSAKSAVFPSLQLKLSLIERRQDPVPQNYQSFTDVYVEEDLHDGYNPSNPILNFVDGYVKPNITVTSCSPSSGTIQGNTLLVIQGTGFNGNGVYSGITDNFFSKIASVTVGGVPVKSYNIMSPTVIVAVTNPGIGSAAYTGNVEVFDQDGNGYVLTNGFSYTTP